MLDPEISLQGKTQPGMTLGDWANLTQTAAGIQNTQQSTANMAAANPGIQATSQMTQNDAAAQQWLKDNSKNYITKDASGNNVVDARSMAVDLAAAGFPNQANGTYQHYLSNEMSGITNQDAKYNLVQGMVKDRALLLSQYPPGPAQNDAAARQQKLLDGLGPAPGSGMPMGTTTTSQFWAKGPDGKPIMDPNGNPTIDNTLVQGVKTSTLPVATQENIRQYNALNHTSPEAMDPSSSQSQAAQALAVQLGYAKKDDPAQSDSYWYNNRPDFKSALERNAPSMNWQDANKEDALKHIKTADAFTQAGDVISKANIPPGTSVGTALANWAAVNTNDPRIAGVRTAVTRIQQDDPSINLDTMDGPSLLAKIQADHDYHIRMSQYHATNSGTNPTQVSGGLPSAGNQGQPGMGVQPQPQPQQPQQPEPRFVRTSPQPLAPLPGVASSQLSGKFGPVDDPTSFRANLVRAVKQGNNSGITQSTIDAFDAKYSKTPPPPAPPTQQPVTGNSMQQQVPPPAPPAQVKPPTGIKIPTEEEIVDYAKRSKQSVEQVKRNLRAKGIEVE